MIAFTVTPTPRLTAEERLRHFQANLTQLMAEKKFSQDDLAKAAKVHQTTISKYLTGSRKPSFAHLWRIAEAFGCTPDQLLVFSDSPHSPE